MNEFSIGLFFWQTLVIVLLIVMIYFFDQIIQ